MRNTIWNKHIPTLLAISIIIIGIALASYLVKSDIVFIGQAEPAETPVGLKFSNISDTSFTVSYSTPSKIIGSVNFGKDRNLDSAALDERDQKSGSVAPYNIHSITVKELTPQTRYFFSVVSGQSVFQNDDESFEVSTGPILTPPSSQLSLKGEVIMPNGEKVKEGIVYAVVENAQIISALIENGDYTLALGSMRTNDLSSYVVFTEDSMVRLLIENDTSKSNVSVSPFQKTVPIVTLSYDYDFTASQEPIATISAETTGFPALSVAEVSGHAARTPQITLPRTNQEFIDQQPQFRGTALPNETVTIIIQSEHETEVKITADAFGNWNFRPTQPLPPGQHTITIITKDTFGVLRSITQPFVVYAQGTQVTQSATPSATPTVAFPTRIPTPTPTPTPVLIGQAPTLTPTPTPTLSLLASPTPTPTPTLCPGCPTPTPTPVLIGQAPTPAPTPTLCPGCPSPTPTPTTISGLTPTPTIADPGDSSLVTIGILGAAAAAVGVLLFLLARTGI